MLYEKCWWEEEFMYFMMFVYYVEKRCEVNDKYYVLLVFGIKEKNLDLESVNWLWLLYIRGVCYVYR